MQPLHDDDQGAGSRVVAAGAHGLVPPLEHGGASFVAHCLAGVVRIVGNDIVPTLSRGLPGDGGCQAEPGAVVFEAVLGVLVTGHAESLPPVLFIPGGAQQAAAFEAVAHAEPPCVGGVEESALWVAAPDPGGPEHAHGQTLHMSGGHVDEQAGDVSGGNRLQMLAHGLDVPSRDERYCGLEHVPRLATELQQGAFSPEGPDPCQGFDARRISQAGPPVA